MGSASYPSADGGFGSDVVVPLPNSAAANVDALETIANLDTNTAAAEVSSWLLKVLEAGAKKIAQTVRAVGTVFAETNLGAGIYTGVAAATRCAVALGVVGTGFRRGATDFSLFAGTNCIAVDVEGVEVAYFSQAGGLAVLGNNGVAIGGGAGDCRFRRNVSTGQADIGIEAPASVVIGADGALATNATTGHLQIPSCAGTPTGTPVGGLHTGKVAILYDTTANKLWVFSGGTWRQTAALT